MKKSSQETSKKKMTIDDLARIIAGEFSRAHDKFEEVKTELRDEMRVGFKKVNQRVDNHIVQTAEGFEDVGKRFDSFEAGTHRRLTVVEGAVKTLVKK